MKKIKRKIVFGLSVLTIVSMLGKITINKKPVTNSNNYISSSEPDNYSGVGSCSFNGGSFLDKF